MNRTILIIALATLAVVALFALVRVSSVPSQTRHLVDTFAQVQQSQQPLPPTLEQIVSLYESYNVERAVRYLQQNDFEALDAFLQEKDTAWGTNGVVLRSGLEFYVEDIDIIDVDGEDRPIIQVRPRGYTALLWVDGAHLMAAIGDSLNKN